MSEDIYIMPVSALGAVTYYALSKFKTVGNIVGFLDSNKGKERGASFCELPVSIPEGIDRESRIIVATFNYSRPITQQLRTMGFKNIINAKSIVTLEHALAVLPKIREDGVEQKYNLLSVEDRINSYFIDSGIGEDKLTLTRMEIVVTQRCTLKCRDCCLLMPYYDDPIDIETDTILRVIDKLFEYVDFIRVINIVGGEPLLVKDLALLFDQLAKYRDRIGDINVSTNGTLPASDDTLTAMKNAEARVLISDYGALSKNKDKLMEQAHQAGLWCEARPNLYWWPRATFSDGSNSASSKELFDSCDEFCSQIMGRKLYYCCFAANGDALRGFPESSDNYIDLLDPRVDKRAVRDYMERTHPLPACAWCTSSNVTRNPIPVAVQATESLPYKRYD